MNKFIAAVFALSIATQAFALDAASLANMINVQETAQGQARVTLSNNSTGSFSVEFNTLNEVDRINPTQRLSDYLTYLRTYSVAVGSDLVIDFRKINKTDFLRIYIYTRLNSQSELLYIKCDVWTSKVWGHWKKSCTEPVPYLPSKS